MDCEVTGLPNPEVTWFKGNKPILSSHKFVIERNTLRINSIMIQDQGVYSCEAINQAEMCKNHEKSQKLEIQNLKFCLGIIRRNHISIHFSNFHFFVIENMASSRFIFENMASE